MAYSDEPFLISMIAETTVSSTALYRIAWASELGVRVGGTGVTTGAGGIFAGICYGYTHSTSTAAQERIPIAVGGVAKVACLTSTAAAGGLLSASSGGWGMTASTKGRVIGRIIDGSSAGAGAVKSVLLFNTIPLVYAARLVSTTG
jgi:hypothetical protein